MKALIIVGHSGIYSGGSFQALFALRGLKARGIDVAAVWSGDGDRKDSGYQMLTASDIPYFLLPINRRPTFNSVQALKKVLRDFQPDVVECVKSGAQYHALLAGAGRREGLIFYRGISRPMNWFQGWKYRLKRVRRVIANCKALKDTMTRTGFIPADKIDVVYGEYDPACADPELVDASGVKSELGIPTEAPLALFLGNYAPWRGETLALEALALLKQRRINIHLLFVGLQTDRLTADVRRLGLDGWVTLSPYRRDPQRLIKASDFVINLSTDNESLSGALLNAQAMGRPAVASALAGSVEIIEDGITGLIVPIGDVAAAADAIGRLARFSPEERTTMGDQARQRALKLFSPEARALSRLKSYQKALDSINN